MIDLVWCALALGFSIGFLFSFFFVELYLLKTDEYPEGIWDIRIRKWW